MLYPLARRALFALDAETAHDLTIAQLRHTPLAVSKALLNPGVASKPVELMGLTFPNPVGLAAGLDKNGECIDAFGGMGFGFVEIGTVTPKPQPGNPKPRIARLVKEQAIINALGFNNKGVDYLIKHAQCRRFNGIVGINIGANKDIVASESVAQILNDYLIGLRAAYAHADYITVNASSPNTPGLRKLQEEPALSTLLSGLKAEQAVLAEQYGKYVPLVFKVAPDLSTDDIHTLCHALQKTNIDGLIATNTTNQHSHSVGRHTTPGLSGTPLLEKSTATLAAFRDALGPDFPIIGVGGITQGDDVIAKQQAGANLVQIYSGFIYAGPQLIKDAVNAWKI